MKKNNLGNISQLRDIQSMLRPYKDAYEKVTSVIQSLEHQ